MDTKTMRLPPRRLVTPVKRKEKDDFDLKPFKASKLPEPATPQAGSEKAVAAAVSSNQLLAGYLAHEYINKGTLFGQPYDPAQSQAAPPVQGSESKKVKPGERSEAEVQKYVEVANLLKTDRAHIPGIVNPTQLARFLQM